MKYFLIRQLFVVVLLAILAGCETAKDKEEAAVVEGVPAAGAGADTRGAGAAGGFQGSPLDDPNSPLSQRSIYFDYDSSDIKPEYRTLIEAHAAYLADHPDTIVTLEGHADERGSREYNLALGERRSISVKRQLGLLGASDGQIRTVSYGEERPISECHNEECWRLNRRVDIVY
jgi:peptidoglycan-associated lipoprotein